MKLGWLLFALGVTACTSASAVLDSYEEPPRESRVPDAAAPDDGGLDAEAGEVDAGPCADCEYFPETCTADVLCPNGPFDPNRPGGALDPRTSINVIRGRSASDIWAAGAVGALAHFDGTSWSVSDPGSYETMRALWLRDSSEVSLGVLKYVYARGVEIPDGGAGPSDGGWTVVSPTYPPGQLPTTALLLSAWAAPGSEWLWCATKGTNSFGVGGLWRIRQSSPTAFEGGTGIPASVCSTLGCGQVYGIHGESANELWAVGPAGTTIRVSNAESAAPSAKAFNSQTWNALNGVWAASATDAWSVGATGVIRHYTGDPSLWEIVSGVPTNVDLNAVWGSSSSDVWAVGDAGVVLHYDGKSWSRVKVAGLGNDRPNLTTVWVAAPGHVWIGGKGVILSLGGKP